MPFIGFAFALLTSNVFGKEKVLLKFNLIEGQRYEFQTFVEISSEKLGRVSAIFHRAERVTRVTATEMSTNVYIAGTTTTAEGLLQAARKDIEKLNKRTFLSSFRPNGQPTDGKKVNAEGGGTLIDLIYADEPVSVGDTWTSRLYQGDDVKDVLITYKLLELSDREARIEAIGTGDPKFTNPTPFLFIVDRATGRPKYVKGSVQAATEGTTIDIKFEMKMIVPIQKEGR